MRNAGLLIATALLLAACGGQAPEPATPTDTPRSEADFPLACSLNAVMSSCRITPGSDGGFTLAFSHADQPMFVLTPVGEPSTDRREMVDSSGRRWAMSGHHSFELEEIGGYGNRITVSSP